MGWVVMIPAPASIVALLAWLWPVLVGTVIRSTILLACAWLVLRFWTRASAAQRALVWVVGCGSAMIVPFLQCVIPVWSVPILPIGDTVTVISAFPLHPATALSAGLLSTSMGAHAATTATAVQAVPGWLVLLLVIWSSGAIALVYSLFCSQRRVRGVIAESAPVTDPVILNALHDAARAVGLTRIVPIRHHPCAIPMVCGVFNPIVVLPTSATMWNAERLRHVLIHELAHVHRYDSFVQTIVSLTCAMYWFNPLIWRAARHLRLERELACDDYVLASGSRPSAYALDLLEIAQTFRPVRESALAALTFARPSHMRIRLYSLINPASCHTLTSARGTLMACTAALTISYPVSGITFGHRYGPIEFQIQGSEELLASSTIVIQCPKVFNSPLDKAVTPAENQVDQETETSIPVPVVPRSVFANVHSAIAEKEFQPDVLMTLFCLPIVIDSMMSPTSYLVSIRDNTLIRR